MKAEIEMMNFKGETIPKDLSNIYQELKTLHMVKEVIEKSGSMVLPMEECLGADVLRKKWNEKLNWHFTPGNRKEEARGKYDEIKGFYIFLEKENNMWKPCYVGISQTVIRRLNQHVNYSNKNAASFAYLMAKHKAGRSLSQEEFNSMEYRTEFQNKIRKMNVEVIPYSGDFYRLQILEVMLAAELKTYWNSFETH